jgi:hypothetical protein
MLHRVILILGYLTVFSTAANASILEYFNIGSSSKKNKAPLKPAAPLSEVKSQGSVIEEDLYGDNSGNNKKIIDLRNDQETVEPHFNEAPTTASSQSPSGVFGKSLIVSSPLEKYPVKFAAGFFIGEGAMNYYGSGSYAFNPLIVATARPYFTSKTPNSELHEHLGIDLTADFQLKNRSLFTPVIGAGVGYETWVRSRETVTYHEASTPTLNYFYGANVKLTNFFELVIRKRMLSYLNDSPFSSYNSEDKQTRASTQIQAGFQVVL